MADSIIAIIADSGYGLGDSNDKSGDGTSPVTDAAIPQHCCTLLVSSPSRRYKSWGCLINDSDGWQIKDKA